MEKNNGLSNAMVTANKMVNEKWGCAPRVLRTTPRYDSTKSNKLFRPVLYMLQEKLEIEKAKEPSSSVSREEATCKKVHRSDAILQAGAFPNVTW